MSNFIYTAKTKEGETKTGHMIAVNQHELAAILRYQNLVLVSAEIVGEDDGENNKKKLLIFFKDLSKKWG